MSATHQFDDGLRATLLICVVYPLGPAATILMPMIVGGLIDGYGYSSQQAGNIAASEGLGVVAASIVAALWIRRVSWVRALAVSCVVYAAINVFAATVEQYSLLLQLRFLTGFFGGNVFAVTVAALGDNREPDRAFGLAQAVQGGMMLAGFAAAPYLIERWGVGSMYYMLAAASVVLMVVLLRFPAAGRIRAEADDEDAPADNHTALILVGLVMSVVFFINVFGFWAFAERIGLASGLPASTIGFALGFSQVAAIGGALCAAAASNRYGRYLPLLIVMIGQVLALLSLLGDFGAATYFVATSLFQALFIVAVSYQMGAIALLDVQGRYLVVMTAAQGLGAAIGPAVAASLIAAGPDYSRIILMAVLFCVISTLAFFFIIYRSRHVADPLRADPAG